MIEQGEVGLHKGVAPLLGSIVSDGRELVRQELALFLSELKHEISRIKWAGFLFGTSFMFALLALMILSLFLSEYIGRFTSAWLGYGTTLFLLSLVSILTFISAVNLLKSNSENNLSKDK